MRNVKYRFIKKKILEFNEDFAEYSIIVTILFLDSYVLMMQGVEYDHLRLKSDKMNYDNVLNEFEKTTGIHSKLVYKGILEDKITKEKHYLFCATINSQELKILEKNADIKTYTNSLLRECCKNDDRYEITYYLKEHNSEDLLLFLIPLGLLLAIGVFIYNIVKGRIIIELLFGFIGLLVVIIAGIFTYRKK